MKKNPWSNVLVWGRTKRERVLKYYRREDKVTDPHTTNSDTIVMKKNPSSNVLVWRRNKRERVVTDYGRAGKVTVPHTTWLDTLGKQLVSTHVSIKNQWHPILQKNIHNIKKSVHLHINKVKTGKFFNISG